MKKFLAILITLTMVIGLAACSGNSGETTSEETTRAEYVPVDMRIATLKGPTGMGMAKLINDSKSGSTKNNYTFTMESDPTQIGALISSNSIDIAACPLNLAATLYKKTNGGIQMLAINTLGVLYILENGNSISKISDLKGKTIYATGQGSTPEYILNFILKANSLEPGKDVTIEYLSEHSELTAKAVAGNTAICMLPEPNVTTAMAKNKNLRIALNLTAEWNKACALSNVSSELAQGCIIVSKSFAQNNPKAIEKFLEEYSASVTYVNKNVEDGAKIIAAQEIVPSVEIAQKAIPNCNITIITGAKMKTIAQQNLKVLFEANPKSVGGSMPDEAFYYGA